MNIDVHAHMIPTDAVKAAEKGRVWHGINLELRPDHKLVMNLQGRTYSWGAAYWDPASDRLQRMNEQRMDLQLLSLSGSLFGYWLPPDDARCVAREANDEITSMISHSSDRLRGLASLPLQDPDASVNELERAIQSLGLDGAVVGASVEGRSWDDDRLTPVLAAAEELQALLLVHPVPTNTEISLPRYGMRDLLGQPLEIAAAWAHFIFGGIFDRFPKLKVCFAQAGGFAPFVAGRFDHAMKVRSDLPVTVRSASSYLPSVYFDTLTYSERSLRLLLDTAGADRVLLGSDYPSPMSSVDPVGWIKECPTLTASEQKAILGENAARLLGVRAPQ